MTARKRMNTIAQIPCITAVWCSPSVCSMAEQPAGCGMLPHSGAFGGRPERVVEEDDPKHRDAGDQAGPEIHRSNSPAMYVASRKPITHKPATEDVVHRRVVVRAERPPDMDTSTQEGRFSNDEY